MRNNIISLILFIVLMCLVFFAKDRLIFLCNEIEYFCNDIEYFLCEENYYAAYEKSISLLTELEVHSSELSIYAAHTDIENLKANCISLAIYIESRNKSDALATVHILKLYANNIHDLQYPSLENIL
ncbi:DUF4363 family protein [uncultured Clostridium sp.]|uniref:DUF4363 family protein n=1 Tax=uncultured Clostridium sp. TaxID=59620 RepID=UPI002618374B|nr:DUF4363 family protein [uncultured Clostridium sp.]